MNTSAAAPTHFSRAWYSAEIEQFIAADGVSIEGHLSRNCENHQLIETQRAAWREEIVFLQRELRGLSGSIYLEFTIPRMGRRIDCVLLLREVVFVVEFKVGETTHDRAAFEQVWDYALDLKNFHEASHAATIVPILIATGATSSPPLALLHDPDMVYRPVPIHPAVFRSTLERALEVVPGELVPASTWAAAPYRPTPTILEAARALYAHHSVEEIARHDAGAQNLAVTSRRVEELVEEARALSKKLICFVTGVPGAGKTLVGLNVATQHRKELEGVTHAVFLSGNGPLVAVLTEALTRDEVKRRKEAGEKNVIKGHIERRVKSFIQNVHHFRDEGVRDATRKPSEHVAIFDEAQRAWNRAKTADFMKRKKGIPDFDQSEPEFLIGYMDRHPDWAVIICLVGGGQEINTGEAGIDAWIDAVNSRFPHWEMVISDRLTDSEYAAGKALEAARTNPRARLDEVLHLSVSMRSFRAEHVSAFVKAVLDCEVDVARDALRMIGDKFPIVVTRDLDAAKAWIRERARGSERYGLVASSKAQRLKPHAIDIRVEVNPVHYFLNDRTDTRSSYYLEDAATEFMVQGLELDWTIVTWDADLRHTGDGWTYHDFRGDRWTNVHKLENQRYLKNAYRVLLTRARQGMVIFVPPGDADDATRSPAVYDYAYQYLSKIGIAGVA